jgi:hypothetical protein
VLVVGHSNTLPAILESLGVAAAPRLTEADYDDLFVAIVHRCATAQLIHLHYGEPTP